MKIKSVLEAQLADKPEVSFARLKRVARQLQELMGAEPDRYDSKKDLLILTVWKTLYYSDIDKLDSKFGPHDEFDIPEFRTPWFRWEVDGVWIILKDYSGNLQFEVLPASTGEQPQDRYLRQRHDEIMDPAKYESVMEAKYFRNDDKYVCPECEGEGGFYELTLDGDVVGSEQCDMCQGAGKLNNRQTQNLIRWGDYKEDELKRVTEAHYEGGERFSNYMASVNDNATCGYCDATFYVHHIQARDEPYVECPRCKKINKTGYALAAFKDTLREAKYAEPTTQELVGEFQFDDRNLDDITMHDRVVVRIKINPDREPHEENNAVLLDNLKFVGGRELEIAKKKGIKKGLEVGFMKDRHGWMVFGWITGPGIHSPWSVTGK